MKQLTKVLMLAGVIAAFGLSAVQVSAQGRGNFDPAQFRQRMMDGLKDRLEIKDDAEWKALEGKIGKVMDAAMEVRSGRMGGFGGFSGRTRGGNSDTNAPAGGGRGNRGGFGGTPSPELEALNKAIESKASEADIAAALEKVRAAAKAKEAKLEAAQEDLKKLLTPRQEAIAVANGLLK